MQGSVSQFERARAAHGRGSLAVAETIYREILSVAPQHLGARMNLCTVLLQSRRFDEALHQADAALALDDAVPTAHYLRGTVLRAVAQPWRAIESYERALRLRPDFAAALNGLGLARHDVTQYSQAITCFDRALSHAPHLAECHSNRAMSLSALGEHRAALQGAERALQLRPDYPEALNAQGIALLDLRQPGIALQSFERALVLRPDYVQAWHNRGHALRSLERHEEALASFDAALARQADRPSTLYDKAATLMTMRRFTQAVECFHRLLDIEPAYEGALGGRLLGQLYAVDWSDLKDTAARLLQGIENDSLAATPITVLPLCDSPALALRAARRFCAAHFAASHTPLWRGEHYSHPRIKVGYLSADFREHALCYLMAGVFERHDRNRFEVVGLSLSPPDRSAMGIRVRAAFDEFTDLSVLDDAQAAAQIRAREVDILVDLMGHTPGARTAILAQRPAAIQISYLGFPASMGAPYIDYLIADAFVVPQDARRDYSERIVYLPECFQANDDRRSMGAHPTREDLGLPPSALVLCCFNASYKINPTLFDIWMRALKACERAVLWLHAPQPAMRQNFCKEAARRGIAPGRLHFADSCGYAAHLSRLTQADLFLDCFPFGAGTTASDALFAGVPLLTCAGKSFAARMAGSLLNSVALPELITESIPRYEARLLELIDHPALLSGLRARLAQNRCSSPLFDTRRFTRHLEAAYAAMQERQAQGLPPEHLSVEALPLSVS